LVVEPVPGRDVRERRHATRLVTAGARILDLDHLRAQVRQEHHAEGTCSELRRCKDTEAFERECAVAHARRSYKERSAHASDRPAVCCTIRRAGRMQLRSTWLAAAILLLVPALCTLADPLPGSSLALSAVALCNTAVEEHDPAARL